MEQVKPIKSFFGRTGGKHFSKKNILPYFKDLEYKIYCEPFIGAGSIFLGRDKKAEIEVINDFDEIVINLWLGMKECGDKLIDYKSYFCDKSIFKWYLLKEIQNRRLKKKSKTEINIEEFKGDFFLYPKTNSGRNSPYKKSLTQCNCIKNDKTTSNKKEVKIEQLKENLFINKNGRFSDGNSNKPNCKLLNLSRQLIQTTNEVKIEQLKEDIYLVKNSFSQKNNIPNSGKINDKCEHLTGNNKYNESLKIEVCECLKEDLYIYCKSFFNKNERPNQNNIKKYCHDFKREKNEVNIEELKEDLYLTKNSFSQNNTKPDKGKINLCGDVKKHQYKESKIEEFIEENEDLDVIVSIEKGEYNEKLQEYPLILKKKKYYIRNKSLNKDGNKREWRLHNPNLCGWNDILKNCNKYHERLKDVIINKGDYKLMIKKYDSEETLFYFDPPWTITATGKKGNKCYSGFVELEDFYNSIKDLKGKWICSYNNHPDIKEMFKDHKIEQINTIYTQKKENTKKTVDILIFSKNF